MAGLEGGAYSGMLCAAGVYAVMVLGMTIALSPIYYDNNAPRAVLSQRMAGPGEP